MQNFEKMEIRDKESFVILAVFCPWSVTSGMRVPIIS